MSETKTPFDLLLDQIRIVVREEIAAALNGIAHPDEKERLLSIDEAARILGGDFERQKAWLYSHSKTLPFAKKLSRKNLRFSEAGLRRWLAKR